MQIVKFYWDIDRRPALYDLQERSAVTPAFLLTIDTCLCWHASNGEKENESRNSYQVFMCRMVKGKYLPDRDLQKLGKIKFSETTALEVEYNVNYSRESIIILLATNIIWYDFHWHISLPMFDHIHVQLFKVYRNNMFCTSCHHRMNCGVMNM